MSTEKQVNRRGFLGALAAGVGALVVGAAAVDEFEQIKRRDHVRKATYSFSSGGAPARLVPHGPGLDGWHSGLLTPALLGGYMLFATYKRGAP